MNPEYYIPSERILKPSQDYNFLRKEGLKYIEKLGNTFWTDYNAHDPGITTLEALSYVITELGYRTDFDTKDLLTNTNGQILNGSFFTAREIMTNAALTELDYRKLLIDIEGITNAWYLATRKETDQFDYHLPHPAEQKLYINILEDRLSFASKDKNKKSLEQLSIKGLNKIIIELDEDVALGDLNTTELEFAFLQSSRWVKVSITPEFASWNDPKALLLSKMDKTFKIKNKKVEIKDNTVVIVVERTTQVNDTLKFIVEPFDKNELQQVKDHFSTEKPICEIITSLKEKKEKVDGIFRTVQKKLHQNRNLTEDFLCVETIQSVEISFCVDVELAPETDSVEAMAQIHMAIEKILNPPVRFYTLSQLMEQGLNSTEIFLGPKLKHGFLNDEELEKAQLPNSIHASDIIAAIMEIKGIVSVENLLMTAYNSLGQPITESMNQKWCLHLSGEEKPLFSAEKSKILLFQKNIPFLLSENSQMLVDQKVQQLKAQIKNYKLYSVQSDLPVPKGQFYQLDEYYSVQEEFPVNYGLGANEISDKVPEKRKAQVKQLKAYLHFYDQLLADFFNQLYNAKNILDIEPVKNTYFPNYLDKNPKTGKDFYSKEIYRNDFKNALLNGESEFDVSLEESQSVFNDRRNRALDHLMARFSESFNDYVFMMYKVSQDSGGLGEMSFQPHDLIHDKEAFLKNYAEISSERGLGIDYLNTKINNNKFDFQNFWETDHRGGYEKRTAKLLGINHIGLRDIVTEDEVQAQWTLPVKINNQSVICKIVQPLTDLGVKWKWTQQNLLNPSVYFIHKQGSKFFIYLGENPKKIATIDKTFKNYEEASEFLYQLIQLLNETYENFYCLEHILIRPFPPFDNDTEDLLTVCLKDDCKDEANNDPYSFKATIVLPGYLSRFKNITFRRYAEQIFRQEAPAHVLLKICWVGYEDMMNFQSAYKNWLENYRHFRLKYCSKTLIKKDFTTFSQHHKELIKRLKELNTIYPEGNLYDCQLSETTNPIVLGNTSLGTL
ncbi:hypothetical protein CHRY9390_00254 [Chryseobacterium aquaeductus]|uniref:Uncharacterized protein n=1 Tax=Chryseobacterium aquaeductus TaxID=2675056 RepID=A0A9N8MDL0_9FLAO|nr:hypothetical protein [Chryseobacterium aquaeductus]CAA7329615.1 hypothetical protein CHRY9390_00254 [Chryseobacterium potabilaquae]CAD7797946.1 hypothetical protein CHRY9390_00254 [Chryseobacterium aquaeductus]